MKLQAPRWQLVLETSGHTILGLVKDGSLHEQMDLGVGRGQNRWLLPRVQELLQSAQIQPAQLNSIVVSQGPGSYTGLRVGLTVAKTLAYALNCPLVAVPSFPAIAEELKDIESLIVLGDALNRTYYIQRFQHGVARSTLEIKSAESVFSSLSDTDLITGPGLGVIGPELNPVQRRIEKPASSILALVSVAATVKPLGQAELFSLEPLYLRGSSAEEKAKLTTV